MQDEAQTIDQTRIAIQAERAKYLGNKYQWAMSDGPLRLFDAIDALAIRTGALEAAAAAEVDAPA